MVDVQSTSAQQHEDTGRKTWRCYFCDEVFTNPGGAADHFGATLLDKPGCLIDYQVQVEAGVNTQRGLGLLMALRKAEAELARYREEDTDLHRAMHAKDCERNTAVMRAEEQGYARGLRDGVNLPADSPERASLAGVPAAPAPAESLYRETCPDGVRCLNGCHKTEPCWHEQQQAKRNAGVAIPEGGNSNG